MSFLQIPKRGGGTLFKKKVLLVAFCTALLFAGQAFCAETTNSVGLGVRGGISFTGGEWDANIFNLSPVVFVPIIQGGEINFGIHPNFSIGLLGYWGRTEGLPLAFSPGENLEITHYIGELVGNVYFSPENEFRPYFTAGIGLTSWNVADKDRGRVYIEDLNGELFRFNDQQMTLMFGAGLEYFLADRFSIGAAARYHLFTSALSQFKDDKDVADDYDVPSGLFEFGLTITGYFTSCEDDDKDGVCNEDDLCPETPLGCIIDKETGCELDGDGDGVCDGLDQCPDTPKDCKVDAAGCHMDSDGDGVCDGIDRCEKTPKDCPIDAYGCPLDTDEDGVWDCRDNCEATRKGCRVDASGCPIDSDKDKVCDGIDQCPGTPEGLQVDEVGCPRAYKIEKELVLVGVTFASNQANLTGGSQQELDKVVESLKALPHVKLEIQGHTDSQGAREHNMDLSQRRAETVMNYFIGQGVSPDRLTAKGYGPDKPIATNDTAAGRSQNRRVELKRLN
jgi:OOP family OmpA-OmpF porin